MYRLVLFIFVEECPYIDNLRNSAGKENQEDLKVYLDMYEKLLRWYFKGNEDVRQMLLFDELKKRYFGSKMVNSGIGYADGLCIGNITALELSYQCEHRQNTSNDENDDGYYKNEEDIIDYENPVCAAVNEVIFFHFGNIFRELAYMFYGLPDPICRSHYMVPLFELYCDVLRQTFEMLDLDWKNAFDGLSRDNVFQEFYKNIPNAIIDAIVVQMKHTDVNDLNVVCKGETNTLDMNGSAIDDENETSIPTKFIPLSSKRIEYLVALLDLINKSI